MKENKTQPTTQEVQEFLSRITDEQQREDVVILTKIMTEATGEQPKMWGTSIVGFGAHHYVYESGREGDTVVVGFSPRKKALVLYGIFFYEHNSENIKLAEKLGKYTHGKGCMYIKKLSDVDMAVLGQMVSNAYKARTTG